jgi:hypothetical protein
MVWSKMGDPGRVLQAEVLKSLDQRAKVGKIKSRGSWGISQARNRRVKAAAAKRRKAAGLTD